MSNLFDPSASDVSMQWLGSIFGGMGLFNGGGDPIVGAIFILNNAIMVAGGVLVTYFILVGIMNTAHEGSVLGKKWPVWVVPRMATASALLLPLVKGYALIQVLVAWLLVQGIGLADKGVSAFVDNQNLAQTLTSSFSQSPIKTTAYNLFLSSVCMATLEQGVKQQGTSVIYTSPSIGITTEKQGSKTFYYFGDKNESSGMTKQTCGYYVVDSSQINMQGSSLVSASDLSGANDINQAQQAQIGSLVSAMMSAGRSVVSSHKVIPVSTIDSAIADYQKAIQQSAFDAVKKMNDNKEMQDNIKKDGWIMLGFWYPKIQAMSSQINKAINNVAVATGPSSFDSDLLKDEYVQNMGLAMETVRNGGGVANYGIAKQVDNSGTFLDKIKGWTKSFSVEGAIKDAIDFKDYTFQKGADPMLTLMTYGGICLSVAGAGFVALLALMGTVGNAPGVGLALQSVLLMFVPLLALVGITLLYILPLIPTLIWVGCISGFILMAIEAIIASSFWGLMILNPNGNHEVIGAGQQGFRLIVALLFKPFLLVVGFWVSILMMNTLGTWVSDMFAYIFDLSQSDSNVFTYIVGKIISPVLYGSIMLVVIKKIFGIVPALPDELIKWIGGGSTGFTGHSKETSGSEATGSANVVAGAVINAGTQAGKDVNGKGGDGSGRGGNGPQIKNDDRSVNSGGSSGSSAGFARMMEQQKSGPNGYDSMMKRRGANSSGSGSAGSGMASKGVSAESSSKGSQGSQSVGEGVSGDEVMETGNTVDDPHSGVGEVMEFGEAPYKHDDANNKSYFVSLKQDDGQVKQIWGADLRNQNFQVGEKVSISKSGVRDGQEFQTKEGKNISHKNMFNVERLNKE
ncbi:DotA/TraY family protein [Burkholderia vietnamiensis]|uniref:DotA/TraY family protein n=1 Tax=Burkholderia vietnamiensis TaxID=60552 RepID=UPI001CF1B32C|nr:DotA/TraY family protein [Burkholderia vietnamiensis]MCA8181851.1 DotA/TraY family protein [Burkholderia vietnamiensis]